MRKFFAALTVSVTIVMALAMSVACNPLRPDKPEDEPEIPPTEAEAPSKFIPFETRYVAVPDSQCCVVYMGSTKVATLYQSGNVIVPKKTVTKADATYRVVYMMSDGDKTVASENGLEMVVAFEDTKDADHDYNDLVFQAKVKIVNKTDGTNSTSLEITPIAHGATKTIGLGVVLYDSDKQAILDQKLCSDVRQQLFNSDQGFINTQTTRKHYDKKTADLPTCEGTVAGVAWYIIVNGTEKLFAASAYKPCLDNFNRPQGMVLIQIRDDIYEFENGGTTYQCGNDFWQYPQEWTKIDTVYPDFDQSFEAYGDFTALATPAEGSKYFDAIKATQVGEKYIVNEDDCLYSLYQTGGDTPSVQAVQLWDGGPKWADRNVGATSPEKNGLFFQWGNLDCALCEGEICEYRFRNAYYGEGSYYESTPGGVLTEAYTSGDIRYDGARATLGGGWRTPTNQEFADLLANTTQAFVDNYNGTGVTVCVFTSKTDPSKSIVFPLSGCVDGVTHKGYGNEGYSYSYCWTCDICDWNTLYAPIFGVDLTNEKAGGGAYSRNIAMTIRAICD